jgi:hypothetical protein
MKHSVTIITTLLIMLFILPLHPAHAGFMDLFKDLGQTVKSDSSPLSEETIIKGLKEALEKGTQSAVAMVSKTDGYYQNPEIKIPLPPSLQKVEKILRSVGFGSTVDQFEQSMNRAAERAAPQALSLFVDTIKQISFDDARKILNGRENEATLYFKDRTEQKLSGLFEPIVHDAMAEVNATRLFQDLSAKTASIPFAGNLTQNPDAYVTSRALDGLFLMLEKEELKIRQDPAARVTDLLKTVFKSKE